MISSQIISDLEKVLKELGLPTENVGLEHPALLEHGDYATNVALKLAKFRKGKDWQTPLELAEKIAQGVQKSVQEYARVAVAKPGFINFTLAQERLVRELQKILKEKDNFGKGDWGKGKTVVIDYSSPNIARPFGIGHLRSTIIGQALYNIYQFSGWKCIGDNHLGDWGTQFGKLIYIIRREGLDPSQLSIKKLEELYIQFHKEAKEKPELEEEGRKWFKRLEDGDKEARKIWQACVDLSLEEFDRIYDLLGVKIDYTLGESFYQDKMDEVIQEAKKKGVARKSEGAWVVEVPGVGPPLMLLKSDGATTYHTRDLATIKYRIKTWNPSLYIYETGTDHVLHFRQLFAAAKKLGYGEREQFVHVAHGMIRSAEGRFSTRKGTIVHLEEVLSEAVARAESISEKAGISKNLSKAERGGVAKAVGIGGIKYNDLKQSPERDILFDWEKILNLEGDSGPYLQYTHARCCSVLAKAGSWSEIKPGSLNINPEELVLLRTFYKFPEIIQDAAKNFAPNLICNFLFDLAQKFNLFYNRWPILEPRAKSQKSEIKSFRLALTSATAQVLRNGLLLLGIEPLERM